MRYRIVPADGSFGTKVFDDTGHELTGLIEVRWVHRAGECPTIELVVLANQEGSPLEASRVIREVAIEPGPIE